jgi:cytochrome c oxidase subunit 2
LRLHQEARARRGRSRRAGLALLAAPGALLLTGCSETVQRGWLPSTRDTTNQTGRIMEMWNGSWIAALAVGALTWGLMLWCVVAYRRRRGETGYPSQIRYNVPLEILYTVVPLMMVSVLFYFTARDQAEITALSDSPDLTINVVGKQWSWDFNYLGDIAVRDDDVYEVGVQAQLNGEPGADAEVPTLYLPVDQRIRFVLTSRDVIHSFWIPAFLYKLDVIPGVENQFEVVPQRVGEYRGKCAELCGQFHSDMLFKVMVVSQADYDQHLKDLRDKGQVGQLSSDLGRSYTPDGGAVPGRTAGADGTGSDS